MVDLGQNQQEPAEPQAAAGGAGNGHVGGKAVLGALVAVGAILISGYLLGKVTGPSESASVIATPSAAPVGPPGDDSVGGPQATDQLAAAAAAEQAALRRAKANPVTGPGRPPLGPEKGGPFGSRRTTGTPEVALTFDDGPDPYWTPIVLRKLREYGVKATFCLVGINVVAYPELVRAIAADGHTMCNHSWRHDFALGSRGDSMIRADMARTNRAIRAAAPGSRVSYYRQPGGNWTKSIIRVARQLGMSSLHWEVDPQDWRKPGGRHISNVVTASTMPGAIVLLHDAGGDRRGTVEALRTMLPYLKSRFRLGALPPGVDPPRLHGVHWQLHRGQS